MLNLFPLPLLQKGKQRQGDRRWWAGGKGGSGVEGEEAVRQAVWWGQVVGAVVERQVVGQALEIEVVGVEMVRQAGDQAP